MAIGLLCAMAILVSTAIFAGAADEAILDGCQEDKVQACIIRKFQRLSEQVEQENVPDNATSLSFSVKTKFNCVDILVGPSCPEKEKNGLSLNERVASAAVDVLCADNEVLLKDFAHILRCWDGKAFMSCAFGILIPALNADFWDLFNGLLKCVQRARQDWQECKDIDILPSAGNFINAFFNKFPTVYGDNKAAPAGSNFPAIQSIIVTLALLRQAQLVWHL